jgi:chromosome segregation ATPase
MLSFASSSRPQIGTAQFQLMKKNSSQFGKILLSLNSQVSALQKQNINLPPELSQALADLTSYLGQIKNATSSAAVPNFYSGFASSTQTIQQWAPQFSALAQLAKLIKQAQTQINSSLKNYTADAKHATTSKFDLTQPLADYNSVITQMQNAVTQTKTDLQSDLADATGTLQSGYFDNLNLLQIKKLALDLMITPRAGLSEASQIIAQDQKQIKSLTKSNTDITALTAQIASAKTQAAQAKIALASSSISVADTQTAIENLASTLLSIASGLPTPSAFAPTKPGSGFQPPAGFAPNFNQPQNGLMQPALGNLVPGQNPPPAQNAASDASYGAPTTPPPPPSIIQ